MSRARLIAVTGHAGPRNRLRALAAGFDEHFVKPVDPKALLGALAEAFLRRQFV